MASFAPSRPGMDPPVSNLGVVGAPTTSAQPTDPSSSVYNPNPSYVSPMKRASAALPAYKMSWMDDPSLPIEFRPKTRFESLKWFTHTLFAEYWGSFILTFFVGGLRILWALGQLSLTGWALGSFFCMTLLIYSLGKVSGAHFNPIVTFTFAMRGAFPVLWVLFFWIAQFAGCITGAAILHAFFPDANRSVLQSGLGFSNWVAMFFETIMTFQFLFVILSVSMLWKLVGTHSALAVGTSYGLGVLLGGAVSGGSLNPFLALCTGIINHSEGLIWPQVAGPFIASVLSVIGVWLSSSYVRNYDVWYTKGMPAQNAGYNASSLPQKADPSYAGQSTYGAGMV